ncbi:MAG: TonB-dependent receptor plug domain-containing protein [Devosiaceae bacterium]
MKRVSVPGIMAGFFVAAFAAPLTAAAPAYAQTEITVFAPFRGIATPIARAGSAVSVITREEIDQSGQTSVAEILRAVPGVEFTSAGGFGSNSDVRIRGGEQQHTMVLIDGVPVTNTVSPRNVFDFSTIAPDIIESIEVLRGPQSALYGSDAIGGVINIVTRQAASGLNASASVEVGSFGTHREVLQVSHGSERIGLLGSLSHTYSDGFSRRDSDFEDDATRQWSGFLRGTAQLSEQLSIDAQVQVNDVSAEFDESRTDAGGNRELFSINGSTRLRHESFDDRWINTFTFYAGITDNFDDRGRKSDRVYDGSRTGAEFTSSFNFGAFGTLLGGISIEQQTARQGTVGQVPQFDGEELYWAAFAMHQFSPAPNFNLSLAGRVDDFDVAGTFLTGRATAVYEIFETETRLHASAGTGANAATLYQRFGPFGANPNLLPEESIGFDAGVTQSLFDGRLNVDVTGFYNSFENLIDYDFTLGYLNRSEATTYGVEVEADARLIPGYLDAFGTYTYLVAKDTETDLRLARRPEHTAQLGLTLRPHQTIQITGTLNWVGGERFNDDANLMPLDSYTRVDVNASWQAHEHLEVFGRIENLFDTDYVERDGYNTAGFSIFGGIRGSL